MSLRPAPGQRIQATPVTGQTLSVDRFRDIPAVKPVVRSLGSVNK